MYINCFQWKFTALCMTRNKYYITPPPTPFPAPQSTWSGSVMSDEKLQTGMSEHSVGNDMIWTKIRKMKKEI